MIAARDSDSPAGVRPAHRARVRARLSHGIIAAILSILAFEYRVSTMGGPLGGFEDDQFVHLSEAQQTVLGEWPSRDFVDIGGMPLTIGLSALAQLVGGRTLLSEAVLTAALLALCAGVLFLLAHSASRSIAVAVAVTLFQIAMAPRFYNYPKLLAYAVGIPALWWYIDRPTRARLAVVAAMVVLALLFRYDHGVYLGVTAVIAVALVHRRSLASVVREQLALGAYVFLLVSPYLLFVQLHGGIYREVRSFVSFSQWATSRTTLKAGELAFTFDRSRRLFELAREVPYRPQIHVRWNPAVSARDRDLHERALGLIRVEQISPAVFAYEVERSAGPQLQAIVRDPLIADTEGIDRSSFTLIAPAQPPSRLERAYRTLRRVRVAPGLIRSENAIPFTFWLLSLLPAATLFHVVAVRSVRPSATVEWREGSLKIGIVALLGLLMLPGLLRGNLGSRLADVSEVAGVCAAWLAAAAVHARAGTWRRVGLGTVVGVAMLAFLSIDSIENVRGQIDQSQITRGVVRAAQQQREVRAMLSATPPFSAWSAEEPGDVRLARYLHDCTAPDDRILALSYSPQLFFMSGRGFAGGLSYVRPELFASEDEQRLMVARIRARHVPIVVTAPEPIYTADYVESFPVIDGYLRESFRYITEVDLGRGRRYRVLVGKGITPTRTYPFLNLPCFA